MGRVRSVAELVVEGVEFAGDGQVPGAGQLSRVEPDLPGPLSRHQICQAPQLVYAFVA